MDAHKFAELWTVLTAAYPNMKTPAATIEVYHRALADLDAELCEAAILDCVSKCKFFPTVAELREAAARLAVGADTRKPALEAWGDVRRAVDAYGTHGWDSARDILDAQTADAIHALGWQSFCQSDVDEEMSWRARFVELYDQLGRRDVRRVQMLPAVRDVQQARLEAMRHLAAQLAAPKEKEGALWKTGP